MATVEARVRAILRVESGKILSPGAMKSAGYEMAKKHADLVVERTIAGNDERGGRLKPLSRRTIESKQEKLRRVSRGKYSASSPRDVMRMTGRLLRDVAPRTVRVRQEGDRIIIDYSIGLKSSRSERIYSFLKRDRPILGLAPASSARGRYERRQIEHAGGKFLATRTRGITIQ